MSYLVHIEMRTAITMITTMITMKPPIDRKVINLLQNPFFSFVVFSFMVTAMC